MLKSVVRGDEPFSIPEREGEGAFMSRPEIMQVGVLLFSWSMLMPNTLDATRLSLSKLNLALAALRIRYLPIHSLCLYLHQRIHHFDNKLH